MGLRVGLLASTESLGSVRYPIRKVLGGRGTVCTRKQVDMATSKASAAIDQKRERSLASHKRGKSLTSIWLGTAVIDPINLMPLRFRKKQRISLFTR